MLSVFTLLTSVFAEKLLFPEGKLTLGSKVFDSPFSAVFRVTDEKKKEFNLRVGVSLAEADESIRKAFVAQFDAEMAGFETVTNAICPGLIGSSAASVDCNRRSLNVMLAKNVEVFDPAGAKITFQSSSLELDDAVEEDLKELKQTSNSTSLLEIDEDDHQDGPASVKLAMDFSKNILTPAFNGRILTEEIMNNPVYNVLANRFGLYVAALAELSESVRLLHSRGVVHLGLVPETVVCEGKWCERMSIDGYARTRRAEGPVPEDAHELYQMAVISDEVFSSPSPQATLLALVSQSKTQNWEDVKTVDWYALGGTLFFVLAGDRPTREDLRNSPTTVSDFFLKHMVGAKSQVAGTGAAAAGSGEEAHQFEEVKKKITEGLLILDGLLQEKRESRLNLDKQKRDFYPQSSNLRKAPSSPASGFVEIKKASALTGVSCGEFVEKVGKRSPAIVENRLSEQIGVASFLQDVCQQ